MLNVRLTLYCSPVLVPRGLYLERSCIHPKLILRMETIFANLICELKVIVGLMQSFFRKMPA